MGVRSHMVELEFYGGTGEAPRWLLLRRAAVDLKTMFDLVP